MQNLFYVPPHQPQDIHPRTPGVKTIVRRGQPERLDLSIAAPGAVYVAPPASDMPPAVPAPNGPSFRAWIGQRLIQLGEWITPSHLSGPNGQLLGQS